MLSVIESFLSGRTQKVLVNGILSLPQSVTSGVPQGSVLGPLFFIVFINDLCNVIPTDVTSKCFADDLKMYSQISCIEDIDRLQYGVDMVSGWAFGCNFLCQ